MIRIERNSFAISRLFEDDRIYTKYINILLKRIRKLEKTFEDAARMVPPCTWKTDLSIGKYAILSEGISVSNSVSFLIRGPTLASRVNPHDR